MAAGHPDYDALLASTLANYGSKFEDNVFGNRPLVAFLKRKDKIEMKGGGEKIVKQLAYGENSTVGSYGEWDNLDVTPQNGATAAVYDWKQWAGSIAISGLEELKNSGEEAIIDLLEFKVWQAEESIGSYLNAAFYRGTPTVTTDPHGLGVLVGDSGTAVTTVGGIDASDSDNDWWESYVASGAAFTTATTLLAGMATAYNTASRGSDSPDVIFSNQATYEDYESFLNPQLRFTDTATLDAGFENLLYKKAPMMFDTDCTAQVLWMLNSKYIKLVGHRDEWFKSTPFVSPANQPNARYSTIMSTGNLTVTNRARQAKLHTLPA